MKGWINIYQSGFWHRAGKPGTLDVHAGDVYLTREDAIASIDPPSHYIDTVPVDFVLPEERHGPALAVGERVHRAMETRKRN